MEFSSLRPGIVQVWRVSLTDSRNISAFWSELSTHEQGRATRLVSSEQRDRYILAHGWARRILGGHLGLTPSSLSFEASEPGKPRLSGSGVAGIEFNLSHSGDFALVAVARNARVGVDLESWDRPVEYLALARRFFSPAERDALAALAPDPERLASGFFACWTRKEAYLKATGYGIWRGLHHFDVSLTPGAPARLLADRLDPEATARWMLVEIPVAPGYSAALVAESPLEEVMVHEARG